MEKTGGLDIDKVVADKDEQRLTGKDKYTVVADKG